MIKNYLLIAFRGMRRQLLYTLINIFGLGVGLACALVIFVYVYGEWSHDRHYAHAEKIYRVGVSFFNLGQFASGPELLGEYLPGEFAGIEAYTRFQKDVGANIRVGEKLFKENLYWADSAYFRVFSHEFIAGSAATSLRGTNSMVVTETAAEKLFGTRDANGKVVEVGPERKSFVVTGIVKDNPAPTHLQSSIWISLDPNLSKGKYWTSASVYNYVLLRDGVKKEDLQAALDRIIEKYVYPASGSVANNISLDQYRADPNAVRFNILALTDIHLGSTLSLELSPVGNATNLKIFATIAIFVLVLACVNFVNLSTARSARRSKEIGIRKTLGTSRARLIAQFLTESVLVTAVAMVLAVGFAELLSIAFFWVTGEQLTVSIFSDPLATAGVILFAVMVGVAAGLYPALHLTSFQAAAALKGNVKSTANAPLRKGLIVFQFAIAIFLIIATGIIVQQLRFMDNKDLGFSPENIISIDNVRILGSDAQTFRDELLRRPEVLNATLHTGQPGNKSTVSFMTFRTAAMQDELTINTYFTDHNYVDVMGLKLVEGRSFNPDLASDTAGLILNVAATEVLGLKGNAVGATINGNMTVIGVVEDFHWESLRNEIGPLAVMLHHNGIRSGYAQLAVKFRSDGAADLLKFAEMFWKARSEEPMAYHFVDDNFGELLRKEVVLGRAVSFFTALAIIISALGLFGLAAFTTEQRTREIGIRKVMGASVHGIVTMLVREFTVLVVISILVAVPAVVYAGNLWLESFAYKTPYPVWIVVAGSLLGLVVSFATVSYHAIKASLINPAETLKYE